RERDEKFHNEFRKMHDYGNWSPISPEMLNYIIALLAFSVGYPGVFWNTSKAFGLIFSFQMAINGGLIILSLSSFSILYKLNMCLNTEQLDAKDQFFLSIPVAFTMQIIGMSVITLSSSVVYFYGYHKFTSFLAESQHRYNIS
ncbi:unnamed protein product, partial [Meganyctiphanes norvegica]